MEQKLLKILKLVGIGFVVLVLLHQGYKAVYNPFTTQTVTHVNYYDGIDVVGMVIRDENVITAEYDGVLSYTLNEGSRVAKNGVIANIYKNVEAANAHLEIKKIESEIKNLEDIQTYNDLYAADVALIDSKIFSSLVSLTTDRQNGKKVIDSTAASELCNYLNRKQIVKGTATSFDTLISSLTTRKAGFEAAYSEATGSITTDRAGYFISVVDGYEQVLSPDELQDLTPEKFNSLKPMSAELNAVGKVVSDYRWYIAVKVPFDYSLTLSVGQKMTLKTAVSGYTDLPVNIECINRSNAANEAVVVFVCKTVSEELAGLRTIPVTIVRESYEGLKVDNQAVRVNKEGVTGVYIYRNNQLKFVEVNLLYTGKYSIVEQVLGKQGVLRLYDEIIVKGRDLYDGKIVE
ncbi:MAG: hypothetical protein IKV36_04085 [Clostridia bacterium]|nr:hypothetical protein [Clostridia bacterium]